VLGAHPIYGSGEAYILPRGAAIAEHLDQLVADRPDLAVTYSLGPSFEGRPLRVIEIGRGDTAIAIDGGHHAREWISVMTPTCIADRLVRGDTGDPRIHRILDRVRFAIVPIVNPDGYEYSRTVDRTWRKNRRGGYGVDLSRNYSVGWGTAGSSGDTSSPNYRGASPFSEPETRAIRNLFDTRAFAAHVDFHSYSQVIVYPWSHRRDDPPDRDRLALLAERTGAAMTAAHGERYTVRAGSELQRGAGGTAGDWTYGERGALSLLVELRPSSAAGGGFELAPEQIIPTCDEALAGVLALAETLTCPAASSGCSDR
jgi:murein tripeptide amidase MpaA